MQAMRLSLPQHMNNLITDNILIKHIAAGDENALRKLFELYGQRMYAYALRLCGDPSTADDILQDSLVTVWQSAKRFRGEGRVIAWLLGIIHHKTLNILRKRSADSLEVLMNDPVDPSLLPDEQAGLKEQNQAIRTGLNQLSREHRMVLELVFYQDMSLKETAKICGCPVGTVKSRLNYAKNQLRGLLNRAGLDAEDLT